MLNLVISLVLMCGSGGEATTRCANLFVFVEGRVEKPLDGTETIEVATEPEAYVKQKPIVIKEDGAFETKVLFDTSNSVRRGDCSRKPKAVVVVLRRNGELVRSLRLEIERDFVAEGWAPDFRVRRPVVLRSSDNGRQTKD